MRWCSPVVQFEDSVDVMFGVARVAVAAVVVFEFAVTSDHGRRPSPVQIERRPAVSGCGRRRRRCSRRHRLQDVRTEATQQRRTC